MCFKTKQDSSRNYTISNLPKANAHVFNFIYPHDIYAQRISTSRQACSLSPEGKTKHDKKLN